MRLRSEAFSSAIAGVSSLDEEDFSILVRVARRFARIRFRESTLICPSCFLITHLSLQQVEALQDLASAVEMARNRPCRA